MTPEDLAQITAVLAASEQRSNAATAAAIAASEQRSNAATAAVIAASEQRSNAATAAAIAASEQRINAATAAAIDAAITAAEERVGVRQDRLLESIAAEFSTARGEMKGRVQAVELRLERIENLGYSMNMQTAGMSRAIGDGERLMTDIIARQSAQQQAFFELQVRVAKIERVIHPEQQ